MTPTPRWRVTTCDSSRTAISCAPHASKVRHKVPKPGPGAGSTPCCKRYWAKRAGNWRRLAAASRPTSSAHDPCERTHPSALPEAAVEVLFSLDGDNYKLQLNTCVKLPGHGWLVAEDFAWINLTAEAAVDKMWMQDFPAAQVRAKDEKKRLFVDFTGSDWCPPCIALHEKVLSTTAFLNFTKDHFVLVTVDFPQNKIQPDNLAQANRILAREFRVDSFPTVLILDANGTEVHRVNGYNGASSADYLKALKMNLNP